MNRKVILSVRDNPSELKDLILTQEEWDVFFRLGEFEEVYNWNSDFISPWIFETFLTVDFVKEYSKYIGKARAGVIYWKLRQLLVEARELNQNIDWITL